MRFIFHPDALTEYADAAVDYEERESGLGSDFTEEIEHAIDKIFEAPRHPPVLQNDIRGVPLRRFPYTILYTLEEDHLLIVAIMHLGRKPCG